MSSWVAPSVAAEIWGISVEQVLAGIADGSIFSFTDGQFLFVDIRGMGLMPGASSPKSIVSKQEFAALTYQPISSLPEYADNALAARDDDAGSQDGFTQDADDATGEAMEIMGEVDGIDYAPAIDGEEADHEMDSDVLDGDPSESEDSEVSSRDVSTWRSARAESSRLRMPPSAEAA